MYVSIEIPANIWTLISSADVFYQVRTGGFTRIWSYEGVTIPTEAPVYSSNQPYWLLSDGSTDIEDYEERLYTNVAGESLWLYSKSKTTVVVNQG